MEPRLGACHRDGGCIAGWLRLHRRAHVGRDGGALAGLAFGFFAWQVNSLWLWGTAILLGFIPAVSGLGRLVEANGQIKAAEKGDSGGNLPG